MLTFGGPSDGPSSDLLMSKPICACNIRRKSNVYKHTLPVKIVNFFMQSDIFSFLFFFCFWSRSGMQLCLQETEI